MKNSYGHADFYPNGGYKQKGCELENMIHDSCSHQRAWNFFVESISVQKPFFAVRCRSYDLFEKGYCINNLITVMGLSCAKEEGDFYLTTNSNLDFAASLGKNGIEHSKFNNLPDRELDAEYMQMYKKFYICNDSYSSGSNRIGGVPFLLFIFFNAFLILFTNYLN